MGFIIKVKKVLCKNLGTYRDGAVRVNYLQIGLLSFMILFSLYFITKLLIDFVNLFIANPMEALLNVAMLIGFFIALGIIMFLFVKVITSSLFSSVFVYLSKDAIVCERMVQSEEVKKIFDEIVALDAEKKSEFLKGINSVVRRITP